MSKLALKKLSTAQTLGWIFSSFAFGIALIAIVISTGTKIARGDAGAAVSLLVVWLIGTFFLRIYFQDKDPTSLKSILGMRDLRANSDERQRDD